MTGDDVDAAWATVHAATPRGWFVGRPVYEERRDEWSMYAFDASERSKIGSRQREWVAVAPTEARVLREMARCLNEFGAGRVPN